MTVRSHRKEQTVRRRFAYTGLVFVIAVIGLMPAAAGASSGLKKVPSGPWYTPDELKVLIRYSNASFAEKQRILAGETREPTPSGSFHATSSGSFHWADAGIGAGSAVGLLFVAGLSTRVLLQNRRAEGRSHA
jgi:hypothetical protein